MVLTNTRNPTSVLHLSKMLCEYTSIAPSSSTNAAAGTVRYGFLLNADRQNDCCYTVRWAAFDLQPKSKSAAQNDHVLGF